jgi:hypothetical protein
MAPIVSFGSFAYDMSRGMPENTFAFWMFKIQKFDIDRGFQRSLQVP